MLPRLSLIAVIVNTHSFMMYDEVEEYVVVRLGLNPVVAKEE